MSQRNSSTRTCSSCGGKCLWADDAWVCGECGDEWYPELVTECEIDVVGYDIGAAQDALNDQYREDE